MSRKRQQWRPGERVIFDDMGNWGVGRIESEGEPGESSRWYAVAVEECASEGPSRKRRFLRADDMCPYSLKKWSLISESLQRLHALELERRALKFQIREAFNAGFDDEEF